MYIVDLWKDEVLALWVPIAVYWVQSTIFEIIMRLQIPFFEKYRVHTSEERRKRNRVSFTRVIVMVLLQQIIQIILGLAILTQPDPYKQQLKESEAFARTAKALVLIFGRQQWNDIAVKFIQNWILPAIRFFIAMVIMDTHQYLLHRLAHSNTYLYKNFHSHHHRLYVPYAFGALYNHPLEGFFLDSCGAVLAYELTGMTPRMSIFFFSFSTLKTINDHCGYAFPWDPLNVFFGNNVIYHDIHHQPWGIKTNFSQPYFTFWDRMLGTQFQGKNKIYHKTKKV